MSVKRRKEKDRANRQASIGGTILLSVVGIILGFALGIAHLSGVEIVELDKEPEAEAIKPKTVYFISGQSRGGDTVKAKERALLQGRPGIYRFNEAELNTWARDNLVIAKNLKPGEEEQGGFLKVVPSTPNFRVTDGEFQLATMVEISVAGMAPKKYRFQAQGYFDNSSGTWNFKPTSAHLGAAQLPKMLLASMFSNYFVGKFSSLEKFPVWQGVWDSIADIKVDGNQVIFQKR